MVHVGVEGFPLLEDEEQDEKNGEQTERRGVGQGAEVGLHGG